jgi:hypothetical protein
MVQRTAEQWVEQAGPGEPGVYAEQLIIGAAASGPPTVLVEVPHGADEAAHYTALAAQLRGPFPAQLEHFFFVNTDVGAHAVGLAVARGLVAADPRRSARVLRCLIPRTFIDCNRVVEAPAGDLQAGGLTAAMAPYVTDPADQALLHALHARYAAAAGAAVDAVCAAGGLVLNPHTYAPRTVGISAVDANIVENLHACYAPERVESWPLRPEVDLITDTPDGLDLSPPGLAAALIAAYAEVGLSAVRGGTYSLHPATSACASARRWPGRLLCLELRRDLLVERWTPFSPMQSAPDAVARLSGPLIQALHAALSARGA